MTKRTYNPEDYSPETQAAMKELLPGKPDPGDKLLSNYIVEIADIIEKAVKKAKQVTEEQVRAGCASAAEAHLTNPKPEV